MGDIGAPFSESEAVTDSDSETDNNLSDNTSNKDSKIYVNGKKKTSSSVKQVG